MYVEFSCFIFFFETHKNRPLGNEEDYGSTVIRLFLPDIFSPPDCPEHTVYSHHMVSSYYV
jgi:hypothetical protein